MNDKIKIIMEDALSLENKVYFFSRYWNALYTIDLEKEKVKLIGRIPEENIAASRLCAGIMHHAGKLIFVPMSAKKIWIYDLKEDSWKGLERAYMTDEECHNEMFRAIKYKNNLFLIGSNYPVIIRMDLNKYELEYWKEPYDFLIPFKSKDECFFRADHLLVDNQLFLASCLNSFVVRLNLDTFDFTWFKVGENDFRYSGITWDGEYYWLSPREGTPIVKWDGTDQTEYFPLPDEFIYNKNVFLGVQYDDGDIVFPGMFHSHTVVINPEHPYDMEIRKEGYSFYRCFGKGGMMSQKADGLFQWRDSGKSKSGQLYCETPFAVLARYFRTQTDKIMSWKFGSRMLFEFPSALPIYLLTSEQDVEAERKKVKVGTMIWEIIRS